MSTFKTFLFILFCLLLCPDSKASNLLPAMPLHQITAAEFDALCGGPGPAIAFFKKYARFSKKVNAAIYAFPFPFGIVGLHRIYLGCAPYVPVVYIASFGGIFGLLPLIDFIVILCDKDVEHYANSGKVFMWVD